MPAKTAHREIKLGDKKLISSVDPSLIGDNFQSLVNLRYTDHGIKGIQGMTKIGLILHLRNPSKGL